MRYADPRNPSHLLARYGFLDETCPATYCKLLPPTVNRDMLDLGYTHERMLFYRTGEVADEVSAAARRRRRPRLRTGETENAPSSRLVR